LKLKLSEPTTSVTDFLLAAELFILGFLLICAETGQISVMLWALSFFSLAISALTGGIFHGFTKHLSLWRTTAIAILATIGFMIAAGIFSSFSGLFRALLLPIAETPILILLIGAFFREKASLIVNESTFRIGLLWVLLATLFGFELLRGGPAAGHWILAGSLITVAGIWIQQAKIGLHKHFNHNDLCHVVFMIGMYFLYCGGLLLKDH
jgi:Family of unknown function (DUF6962)